MKKQQVSNRKKSNKEISKFLSVIKHNKEIYLIKIYKKEIY